MPRIVFSLIFFLFSTLPLHAASGLSLRCNGDLVSPGYLKFEVIQACGPPLSRELVGEVELRDDTRLYGPTLRRDRRGIKKTFLYLEEWIYDRGGLHVLRFEGNRLVAVESIRRK